MNLMKTEANLGPNPSAETFECRAAELFHLEIRPCWTDQRQVCWLPQEDWQSPEDKQINKQTDIQTSNYVRVRAAH